METKKQNLGKRREVGTTFIHSTKKQMRYERRKNGYVNQADKLDPIVILRPGHTGFFTKGKRRYFCEVVKLVETRTGLYYPYVHKDEQFPTRAGAVNHGRRWWQFNYLVRIIQN